MTFIIVEIVVWSTLALWGSTLSDPLLMETALAYLALALLKCPITARDEEEQAARDAETDALWAKTFGEWRGGR